jgi:hypothetical protein
MMEVNLVLEAPFVGGAEVHVTVVFLEFCVSVEKLFHDMFRLPSQSRSRVAATGTVFLLCMLP